MMNVNLSNYAQKRLRYSSKNENFLHFAIIFSKKGNILSYGENYTGNNFTVHAEHDCINKLPTLKNKVKKVCLLAVRITKANKITMSKPCMHCIEKMNQANSKGYKIDTVYYSTTDSRIEKCSLNKLNKEPIKHISRFYKNL